MNKDIKRRWVEALRSGRYRQGKSYLRRARAQGARYCCLGVLTDLYFIEHPDSDEDLLFGLPTLAEEVSQWSGLLMPNPIIANFHATDWNDSLGASFKKIADLIDEEL